MKTAPHIVSVLDIPNLEKRIKTIAPDARLTILKQDQQVPENLKADILLVHTRSPANIDQLVRPQHEFRWIHVNGAGVDYYSQDQIGDRLFTSAVGATSLAIAEWAMAMILSAAKDLPNNWVKQKPEKWFSTANGSLAPLQGSQLSLLGFGNIGRKVASRALAFEMNVKALVRTPRESDVRGVEFVSDLDALLKDADHLLLCLPDTPDSHYIINTGSLSMCKPGLHLINVARGGLIDEDALLDALNTKQIGLASLDVAEVEPVPADHWMYSHDKVRLSPHVSWSSADAFERLTNRFLENLQLYINEKPLHGTVNFGRGY